jgi:hypothetical protein
MAPAEIGTQWDVGHTTVYIHPTPPREGSTAAYRFRDLELEEKVLELTRSFGHH